MLIQELFVHALDEKIFKNNSVLCQLVLYKLTYRFILFAGELLLVVRITIVVISMCRQF